jgi:hypothetical protein
MKMEQTGCSETLAYKIQTPGNYPEENKQLSEEGESLKSRIVLNLCELLNICAEFCISSIQNYMLESNTSLKLYRNTVESRFATVRFRTIHFYDPYRVGPTTPDL